MPDTEKVTIKFDANQEYQLNAISAVTDLFEGRPKLENDGYSLSSGEDAVPNADEYDSLSDCSADLQSNFFSIQNNEKNHITENIRQTGLSPENDGETLLSTIENYDSYSYPEFTVNMETGTGKTYVYLRTIFELRKKYGFTKFIIVVPSIAIFEGTVSAFNAAKAHFKVLYGQEIVPDALIEYDGNEVKCKNFAIANHTNIMVMTIASFNSIKNRIFKSTDKIMGGKLPIHFIQEVRPILILDEVQNYQTDIARKALRTLHPYFSVGYSATPATTGNTCPNLLHKLSSFDALQLNLVKKIEIYGAEEELTRAQAEAYIQPNTVINHHGLEAIVELQVNEAGALKIAERTLKTGDRLREKTHNDAYGNLYVINMSAKKDDMYIELSDHRKYSVKKEDAMLQKEEIFRQMIRNTILTHIEKQKLLRESGYDAKVLSLFFIDKVSNYSGDNPIIKQIFDEEFNSLKGKELKWRNLSPADVRVAYFAKTKNKQGDEEFFDSFDDIDKKERDKAEKEAYELIMRGKETLLSNTTTQCFIFAHSALREGWDNPNVFQICALRDIRTENARRQTIGRGLRLPVCQNGERIRNKNVNILTVIANESYSSFVRNIQFEYEEDGTMVRQMFTNRREKITLNRNKNFKSDKFQRLWDALNKKTVYTIHIDSEKLIQDAISQINKLEFLPPRILTSRGKMVITKYRMTVTNVDPNGKQATLLLETADSNGRKFENNRQEIDLAKNVSLDRDGHSYLSKFVVQEIFFDKSDQKKHYLLFKNLDKKFELNVPQEFDTTSGQRIQTSAITTQEIDIPKCNLLERVEKEIPLTRTTIFKIFSGLETKTKMEFVKNPESFVFQFVSTLKEIYMDHVASNLQYSSNGEIMSFKVNGETLTIEDLFQEHPVISASEAHDANEDVSIYDKIQVDSDNERYFVNLMNECGKIEKREGKVIIYFKFPPQYKISIPKIIGNYNPDWAITTCNHDNETELYMVRETKGTEDLSKLWHTNERRKIECATKHFETVGVNYRAIKGDNTTWYLLESPESKQTTLPIISN